MISLEDHAMVTKQSYASLADFFCFRHLRPWIASDDQELTSF